MATIKGGSFNDNLKGTALADVVSGEGGDDILDGAGGADALNGGIGNDTLVFNAADFGVTGLRYNGGAGTDSLMIGGGQSADFTAIADNALRDIEIIDIDDNNAQGFSTLRLSSADARAMATNVAGQPVAPARWKRAAPAMAPRTFSIRC